MKTADFDFLADLLKKRSGLVVTPDKSYLLESRLMPIARKKQLKTLDELVHSLRTRGEASLIRDVVDAMTTNESLFFRDTKPFDQFRDVVLPTLMTSRASKRSIKIWSAACSSGQEPYSLLMLLAELGPKVAGWRVDIMATDISAEMLQRAKNGVYSQFEVQRGLPIQLLVKYFKQDGDRWQIDDKLRRQAMFREFNLLDHPRSLGTFDVVFCRNVLIYFDQPTKTQVLNNIADVMQPDGYLYLGGAETVIGITDRFAPVSGQRGLYQPTKK